MQQFGTDLRQLLVLAFDKALLWTLNADQVGGNLLAGLLCRVIVNRYAAGVAAWPAGWQMPG